MTKPDCSAKTTVESADSLIRPEDIQEMFGIKQRAYYNRIKYLGSNHSLPLVKNEPTAQ
jgi:hypothetical protein